MSDSGESSTEDEEEITETETEDRGEREEVVNATDLEKAETERDGAPTMATRPTTLQQGRTRSNRRPKEEPHPPVGFWNWQMVSSKVLRMDLADQIQAGVRLHVLKLWCRTSNRGHATFHVLC
jgi:hypothetical protein